MMDRRVYSLNRATGGRRLAAWLLDLILIATLSVGFMLLTSLAVSYDKQQNKLFDYYRTHEVLVMDDKNNEVFCKSEDATCQKNWQEFAKDKDAIAQYNKVNELTVVILTVGVFSSLLVTHFIVPLILKDGRTVGKRIMGISLISTDEIRVNTNQMFIRFLMGEFLVTYMIPIILIFTAMISGGGLFYTLTALAIMVANILCLIFTKNRQNLSDLIGKTIAVDTASQIICDTKEELSELKYTNEEKK